jgi:predicted nucleotidyltransferase
MHSEEAIQKAVSRILDVARPSKIILFGSHARGEADSDSDLDIMVIQPEIANKFSEMIRLRHAIGNIGTGVDVLVYAEDEAERRGNVPGTVIYWALKEGKVLYEAPS